MKMLRRTGTKNFEVEILANFFYCEKIDDLKDEVVDEVIYAIESDSDLFEIEDKDNLFNEVSKYLEDISAERVEEFLYDDENIEIANDYLGTENLDEEDLLHELLQDIVGYIYIEIYKN